MTKQNLSIQQRQQLQNAEEIRRYKIIWAEAKEARRTNRRKFKTLSITKKTTL